MRRMIDETEARLMSAQDDLASAKRFWKSCEESESLDKIPFSRDKTNREIITEEIKCLELRVAELKAAVKYRNDEGWKAVAEVDSLWENKQPPFEATTQPKWMHDMGYDSVLEGREIIDNGK